ncbi:helix-turn-helix domain-containing protein [Citromicrobium sp. WPS32]|uniref:helix-turn-helix domain-containing protein n=1 Tax=Citromicrobium sp. WPS32 TaxID=1634517 RepID=UPI0006D9EEA5|nr:hypothetical protein WG75_14965 [Citromicrobium sp. WPS32]
MAQTIFTEEHRRFIARLREARRAAKLTQEELSAKLGKHQSYISNIERGQRRLDVVEFASIAKCLDHDPAKLYDRLISDQSCEEADR